MLEGLRALNEAQNTQQIFENLVEVLRRFIFFDDAMMLQTTSSNRLESSYATSPDFRGLTWKVGGMFQRVLGGQTVAVFDTDWLPDWQDQPDAIRARVRSAIHAPLHTGARQAILVFIHAKPAFFNKTHLRLLERFAPLANQALANIEYRERLVQEVVVRLEVEQDVQYLMQEQQTILDNAGVGIAFPKDRHIGHCNQEFATMFGYRVDELVGTSTRPLHASDEIYESCEKEMYATIGMCAAYTGDARYRRHDGTLFWVDVTATAIDRAGLSNGVICVMHDIDQRKKAELLRSEQGRVLEMSATGTPLEQVLENLMVLMESQPERVIASILLLEDDGLHLRQGAAP